MKYLIYALLIGILTNKSVAQDFINGDLDGNINNNVFVLPSNWDRVPFGDINCHATDWAQATPDLTDRYGPWASTGLIGIPYSGTTFVHFRL